MKKWLSLVFCALVGFGCFMLAGCEDVTTPDENAVTKIEVTQAPKTFIKGGELGEVKIKVTQADGSVKDDVTVLQDALTGFEKEKSGEQTVTVTYQENTASFTLTVFDKELSSTEQIANAVFVQNDGEYWHILNGTYPIQLIVTKNITVIGQSRDGVILSCPENFAEEAVIIPKLSSETFDYAAIIGVSNTQATIKNLTVKGNPEMGYSKITAESRYVGIAAVNADLAVEDVTVTDVRFKSNLFGMQNGYGIFASSDQEDSALNLKNCMVKNFQKGGIYALSPIGKLSAVNCTVTGAGAQAQIAQNGIVFSCLTTVTGCTVSDLIYSPEKMSVAIFSYNAPINCVLSNNTVSNVDYPTVEDAQ